MKRKRRTLELRFRGGIRDRQTFLLRIRDAVTKFTGEQLFLDALINEIAKNIFDHARGRGSLAIRARGDSFKFVIKDDGDGAHDFEHCLKHSALAGNGINYGKGLRAILDMAESLRIELRVETSKGFSYSGTCRRKRY